MLDKSTDHMPSQDIDVSIIYVNYKTSRMLADSINSLLDNTFGMTFEIIVVDNDSCDDSREFLLSQFGNTIKYVQLNENVGFGLANNAGFDVARGDFLFCVNPDTIILNNALGILHNFMMTHHDAGACGGNLLNASHQPTLSYKKYLPGVFDAFNELMHCIPERLRFGKNRRYNFTGTPMKVAYVTGADIMLRREALIQSEPFRCEFFMYYEETDLCFRLKKKGWSLYSVPDALILHLEGASAGNAPASEAHIRRLYNGRDTYLRLNKNKLSRSLSNIIYSLFLISRTLPFIPKHKREYYNIARREFDRTRKFGPFFFKQKKSLT